MNKNNKIKCNVSNCIHNNKSNCNLTNVTIGSCNKDKCNCTTADTICESFEADESLKEQIKKDLDTPYYF